MLKLIKLEYKKNNIFKYIRNALIMILILSIFIFSFVYLGIAIDENTGEIATKRGMEAVTPTIEMLYSICFLIFTSVMLSTFIVTPFLNRKMGLMFTYPISRRKILSSQMIAVWIFNFIVLLISKLFIYWFLLFMSKFMKPDLPLEYDVFSISFILQNIIKTIVTVSLAYISLFLGLVRNSSKTTIVSSFLLVVLIQGNLGDLTLKDNTYFTIGLLIAVVIFIYLSLKNIELKDIN